jgi:hypothetical protein
VVQRGLCTLRALHRHTEIAQLSATLVEPPRYREGRAKGSPGFMFHLEDNDRYVDEC